MTGKVTQYHYNLRDQVSEVWDDGRLLADYSCYPDGRVKSLENGDSLYTLYSYDRDKNLTHQTNFLGEQVLVDNHYRHDRNGNLIEKKPLSGITRYGYDALNRLKTAEYPAFREELSYDQAAIGSGESWRKEKTAGWEFLLSIREEG